MSFVDELARLEQLRANGTLTDDEFQRAKARLLEPPPAVNEAAAAMNRLRRSRDDRWIGGVCGGIARATGVESWIWRLLIAVLFVFGGTGLVIYVLLWIFVPEE
ncbi:MAG: PspC domain-containing protein [Burkholderiales bacterium]|jgi:phage shock protein PspC (stress-responsive transcriptional regulator)|nr:PspC domain-containing protein [Burkholderiales bacterium]